MPSSVTALSGVNWTDLNGLNLSAAAETTLVTSITEATTLATDLDTLFQRIPANQSSSINDMGNIFTSEAKARAHLTSLQNLGTDIVYSSYIKSDGTIGYLINYRSGNERVVNNIEVMGHPYSVINGVIQVHFLNFNVSIRSASSAVVYNNPLLNAALTHLGFTNATSLNAHQRELVIRAVREQSYIEASKLSVRNGGGFKTYNGSWYVNGEKVSYLEITLAVRVNQLYVINEAVTEQLKQVQLNNKKIKFANSISSIIANKTPANSSGTQDVNEVAAAILLDAIKEGIIPVAASEEAARTALAAAHPNQNSCGLYRDTNGRIQLLMRNWDGPTWTQTVSSMSTANMVDSLKVYAGRFDLTELKAYFPSSFEKLFTTYSIKTTGSLTQTECTTLTTELKATITGIDSNNQVLQTQLSQYNDKRTEVLDSMSSIIKGHNGSMAGIGRNLSAT